MDFLAVEDRKMKFVTREDIDLSIKDDSEVVRQRKDTLQTACRFDAP
jgi:hypothetical protein